MSPILSLAAQAENARRIAERAQALTVPPVIPREKRLWLSLSRLRPAPERAHAARRRLALSRPSRPAASPQGHASRTDAGRGVAGSLYRILGGATVIGHRPAAPAA
ncbi:hypothetical protein [Afifella sp. IM 167]|uniref:hypothetical protein n=1 Tax=Afifella sp. IM 167 TaxID=2033586 RepID=UPI001CC968A2|nr:hypothetical protein [Afifella sp. IM 167]MBZ8131758.1 hypothetical protein [Afifella sp. IM 167]